MRRNRVSALLMSLALLLALAPVASAQPAGPSRLFLPVLFARANELPPPPALFWAERYSLPEGGCTMLRWKTQGANEVFLDGARVAASGAQEVCPYSTQFYTLEVRIGGPIGARPGIEGESVVIIREVVLTAGEPPLKADEVIAQGAISAITPLADVDPLTPGNQPGFRLALNQVNKLWAFDPGWNHRAVALNVPQTAIDLGESGPAHWPLHAGQSVEFWAACDSTNCLLDYTAWHYLYMTSE